MKNRNRAKKKISKNFFLSVSNDKHLLAQLDEGETKKSYRIEQPIW